MGVSIGPTKVALNVHTWISSINFPHLHFSHVHVSWHLKINVPFQSIQFMSSVANLWVMYMQVLLSEISVIWMQIIIPKPHYTASDTWTATSLLILVLLVGGSHFNRKPWREGGRLATSQIRNVPIENNGNHQFTNYFLEMHCVQLVGSACMSKQHALYWSLDLEFGSVPACYKTDENISVIAPYFPVAISLFCHLINHCPGFVCIFAFLQNYRAGRDNRGLI